MRNTHAQPTTHHALLLLSPSPVFDAPQARRNSTGRPASRPLRSAAARRAGQGRRAKRPLTRPSTVALRRPIEAPETRLCPSVVDLPPCSAASRHAPASPPLSALTRPARDGVLMSVGTRGVPPDQVRRACGASNTGLGLGRKSAAERTVRVSAEGGLRTLTEGVSQPPMHRMRTPVEFPQSRAAKLAAAAGTGGCLIIVFVAIVSQQAFHARQVLQKETQLVRISIVSIKNAGSCGTFT